jgi:hypothetical protein
MLLCPPQTKTSPNRTSDRAAVPPAEDVTEMVAGVSVATCGGRRWRHTPSAPVVLWNVAPLKVVVTVDPGVSKPHTTAGTPRWRTAWSPSAREKVIAEAAWREAAAAAAAATRAGERASAIGGRVAVR